MSQFARRTQFAVASTSGGTTIANIAYRSSSTSTPGNATAFTVTIPSSVQVGDGLVLVVSSSSATLSSDPTGWTATSSGTIIQGSLYVRVLTRVAQSGDANQSVSLSFSATNKASASILAYGGTAGASASDNFIDVLQTATSSSTATHPTPAVTTTLVGDWILSLASDKASSTTATANWTVPGDETFRSSVYNSGAGATTLAVADTNGSVSIGNVGAKTFTSDQVQTNGITWTLALKAGTGSSGGGSDTTPPSAPSGLTATAASSSSINLSWGASTDNVGVTKYSVYRNSSKIASPTATNYTDSGLSASTNYTYYVTASDAVGNESAHSGTASATTSSSGGSSTVLYGANMGGWFHNGETVAQGTARIKSGDPVNGYGPGLFAAREWKSMTSNWSTLMGTEADGRALYIDLGSDFNGVNNGNYDATYQAICQNAPTDRPIWLTFCHEPENQIKNGLTPAVWAACQQRLSYIHAQYAPPNVKFAPILMGGSYSNSRYPSSAPGNVIWSTWFDFDLTHVDALGIDIYPWSTDSVSTAIKVETDPVLAAAQQTGKHICIGEFGLRNEYNWTDAQEASMLTDLINWCDSHSDIVDLCLYFESDNPPGTCCLLPDPYATEPNFPQAAAVWRSVCNR